MARHQVIIVGGGPVGVGLAVELGQRGISCALVERRTEPQRIPKGQNLTQRTLEHFYFWNCVDELRAARLLPPGYPIGGVTAYRNLMSEYWHTQGGRELVQSYYFQKNERLPQYLTEEVLRNRMKALPSVTDLFGWSADQFEQDERGVRVTINQVDGSGHEVLEGDYMVGCDGGRSAVREWLGIDRGGRNFDNKMVLAVFRSRRLHEALKRFPERTTYRAMKPELHGYWQFFGRVDVGEGWFFHAPVPRDATPDNFDYLGLLEDAAGCKLDDVEFDHVGFWELQISVANKYQVGRAFIAGDASHTHPPYGGFGLNSGLEDVVNLGWKVAAKLQGWGGDKLLDSYGDERRPIFVETGEAVIAGGIDADDKFMQRYSPEKDKAEFERAWKQHMEGGGARQQSYEPHYEGSSVVAGPPNAVCSIHGRYAFKAQAGHHLAPQTLSSGRNVFEELGSGFTLVALGLDAGETRGLEDAAQALHVPLKVVRDSFEDEREAFESHLLLIRPDQYVVWAADRMPEDSSGLLRRVTGLA